MSNFSDHARGMWERIISELIGPEYAQTRKRMPCPSGGDGKDPFRLGNKHGTGTYFCRCSPDGKNDGLELIRCVYGCGHREAIRLAEGVIGESPREGEADRAERKRREAAATYGQQLWHRAERSRRSRYLEGRGLEVPPGVRFIRSLQHRDSDGNITGSYPAMVAPIVRGGELLSTHVTYISGGSKAPVDPVRKILPAKGPLSGAAVPLYRAGETLGVAEGIETAIAARMLGEIPVHAALNTALLANWEPPEGVRYVVVFADRDANYAGHAAAYQLAHRLAKKGYAVDVHFPRQEGDFNDVLWQREAV